MSQDYQVGLDAYNRGDFATALREWTLAAEQGNADAQYNLGLMYDNGRGVPQDYATAAKWYTLAAEQGFALAQNNLGFMYGNGVGVPQDYVYAHMWFNIAASSGHKGASGNRDFVAEKMTPSQIEKAQDLARECVAKNYKGC